jgi:deoxycytidine triphosphate deaminase
MIKFWQEEIKLYDKEFEQWLTRGKRITERYRDERKMQPNGVDTVGDARFNILWANVETIFPSVYNKLPNTDLSRR